MCDFCQGEGCIHGREDHACQCDVQGNQKCPECGCECNPWWSGVNLPDGVRDLLWDTNSMNGYFPASKVKLAQSLSSDAEWFNSALPERTYQNTSEIATALISSLGPLKWNREPTQLIYKPQINSLVVGQKLSVGQDQLAFMVAKSGKICDKFSTGEYTVSMDMLPLLTAESRKSLQGYDHFSFDGSPVFLAPNMEFEVSLGVTGQTKALRRVVARGIARIRLSSSPELFLQKLNSKGNYDTTAVFSLIQNYCSDLVRKEMALHEYDELKDSGALLAQQLSEGLKRDLRIEPVKISFDYVGEMGPAMFMPTQGQVVDPKNAESMRKWAESVRQSQMAQMESIKQMQQMSSQRPTTMPRGQAPSSNVCSSCGFANPSTSKFCGSCGKPLASKRACPKCGQEVGPTVKFCGNCGANLSP